MSQSDENTDRDWSYEANRTPPIHAAAEQGNLARAKRELDADPSLVNLVWREDRPLHAAACNGRLQMVKYLLECGADINSYGHWGNTPLHHAVWNGSKRVVDYLLDAGADAYLLNLFPFTPLQLALCNNPPRPAIAKSLLKKGVRLDVFSAAILDKQETVREMLAASPNSLATAPWRDEILEMLCVRFSEWSNGGPDEFEIFQSHEPIMRLLVEHGARVAAALPLLISSAPESLYYVEFFLSLGADVNYTRPQTTGDSTPLRKAISGHNPRVAEILRRHGAHE